MIKDCLKSMLVWLRLIPFDAKKNDGDDSGCGLHTLLIDFEPVEQNQIPADGRFPEEKGLRGQGGVGIAHSQQILERRDRHHKGFSQRWATVKTSDIAPGFQHR